MIANREKEDIKALLDYTWVDEEKHYQSGPSKDHIFIVLKRLAKRIGYQVT
ncbi:MAG: hypothetical protein Q8O30_12585 [Candidatus Omnitrophota bacterium]|nr:hypothetical protein [Candidatus Omnitrophota bacterium]